MIKIEKKEIGDGFPTFITFEAGATHNGVEDAKNLARLASIAGADAIKFQIFDPDELIADKHQMYSYEVLVDENTQETETVEEPLYDIFVRRSLSCDEWKCLRAYCSSLGITFFATIGDDFGLELVRSLNCDSVKIASSDINYHQFIREVAKLDVAVQLDTGNSHLEEVAAAIDVVKTSGNNRIILHVCPSGYPASFENVNLKGIQNLRNMFGCPVAYSDHTAGDLMDVAAVCFGANMIEKTITMDRKCRSVEHIMSLEPSEFSQFIHKIRNVESAFGESCPTLTEKQLGDRLKFRRSVILDEAALIGQRLHDVRVKFKRPGYGVSPDAYEEMRERVFKRDLPVGAMVKLEDLS